MQNKFLSVFFTFYILYGMISITVANDKKGQKKIFSAQRITTPPKIDGVLNDEIWNKDAPRYTFSQLQPDNGADASFETQIQVFYDDKSVYVLARLFDPEPDQIKRELGLRDDGNKNADSFSVLFDTYNKGQNGFLFGLTAAGVQSDAYVNNDNFDDNWDAVWKSAISIDDKGWVIEMEIPYYAIRFPNLDVQTWGINFYRKVQRKREESFWNHVDKSVQGFVNQSGTLQGIEGIDPPLRLSFLPYASTVHVRDKASGNNDTKFNGGMDLKYGINEAFTLDMSLIPDFSQVQSDDQVLNLSAFEVRFDERRPFFTEGTDLFNRGGLFYSRRVGKTLGDFSTITDYDTIISTPSAAPLLNAVKLSGRTKKGMGIGLFNGVTRRTFAEIATPNDTTGSYVINVDGGRDYSEYKKVEVMVDPLTNYNVFVIDQNLKNNSNIALINTNVSRTDGYENVNFTGTEFTLYDKTNTYRIGGFGAIGYSAPKHGLGSTVKNDKGFRYTVSLGKVSGNWQFRLNRRVESDEYNPNDLGFLWGGNNEISNSAQIRYSEFNPIWIFNNFNIRTDYEYAQLYETGHVTGTNIRMRMNTQFKNFWSIGSFGGLNGLRYDYFEAREDGRVFNKERSYMIGLWMGTDSRKALYINFDKGRWKIPEWNSHDHSHSAFVRYRVNNKLSFNYRLRYQRQYNGRGFVTNMTDEIRADYNLGSAIIFGQRNVKTTTNVFGVNYTFNNKMGLSLRVRHYWRTVGYSNYFELDTKGDLQTISYDGLSNSLDPLENEMPLHDQNFNAFNLDLNYSWQIAPGSFITINWKDAIIDEHVQVEENFGKNFNNTINANQQNTFSIKITYFIDYLTLKNSMRKSS